VPVFHRLRHLFADLGQWCERKLSERSVMNSVYKRHLSSDLFGAVEQFFRLFEKMGDFKQLAWFRFG
jgi:hypothetical protein